MWEVFQSVLQAHSVHILILVLGVLSLLLVSVPFSLPDLRVSSKVSTEVANHQEVHDSLIDSTLKTFSFHLNLSSISFGVSIFIICLIILLSRRQHLAIVRISAQVLKQQENIEILTRWNMGKNPWTRNLQTHHLEDELVKNWPRESKASPNRY